MRNFFFDFLTVYFAMNFGDQYLIILFDFWKMALYDQKVFFITTTRTSNFCIVKEKPLDFQWKKHSLDPFVCKRGVK